MADKELVFVHGRAQQGKDSIALKKEWIDAWKTGLAKSGLTLPIPEERIRFPFYGDTLDQLVSGVPADKAAQIVVRGPAGEEDIELQKFVAAVAEEAAQKVAREQGMSETEMAAEVQAESGLQVAERGPLNWRWVQGLLAFVDRRVPGGSGVSIGLFTRDVYQYITDSTLKKRIDDGVMAAMTPGVESVVVAHSLGTVVSYALLKERGVAQGWKVPLYITLGSPLAVSKIRAMLKPLKHPECATHWFNAMDPDDVVSLYPLDTKNFPVQPSIENKIDVDNFTPNQHGIAGYLSDAEVAKRIYDAVT